MTDSGSYRKVFITLQKRIDSLQEAYIHPPEPCDVRFIMDGHALLTFCGQLKKTPTHCNDKVWKTKDNFLYNSDWIRLKEESHIHLGCLEGE